MSLRTPTTMHFTLLSKNVLSPEEQELYELADLAGVVVDPSVFKIVLDLLKMNVAPTAVLQMLKSMCGQRRKKAQTVGGDHSAPDPSSHLPARSRDEGKSQHSSHRVRSGSPDMTSNIPARTRDEGKSLHSSHRVRSGSHGRTSSRSDPRK
ncbi:mitotic-spindle organizing protein 2B-like [Ylistrum balloti]|uniref:mitotic-spindle organizing protein 2B-like n=1 Tax=Ylistrum balloti TaxID=509963 RepID=UPI002905C98A|nr:mitotic-spindle organizing protein 2B-like [Ylistrum balloti]XP_060072734.1 mitotic-spindle organizing protein 2B-like [Ylistrum balloti]